MIGNLRLVSKVGILLVVSSLGRLGEMGTHVLLQVEVSQLLIRLQLQETSQLLVGIDLATIVLVLKIMLANVGVNLTSDLCACH